MYYSYILELSSKNYGIMYYVNKEEYYVKKITFQQLTIFILIYINKMINNQHQCLILNKSLKYKCKLIVPITSLLYTFLLCNN